MKIGPNARATLSRLALTWDQGQHVLLTGGTGSGKTTIARYLDQIRLDRGGSVVVFVAKLRPDPTLAEHYKGFKRWKKWNKHSKDKQVLLWPDIEGKPYTEAIPILRSVFREALHEISKTGRWTVHIDEGLFTSDPKGIGLGTDIGFMYSLIRSAEGTMITLAQRPSNLPLSIYSNVSYAFVSYARELSDLARLANLDGSVSSKELREIIQRNQRYDFTFLDAVGNAPPRMFNLAR